MSQRSSFWLGPFLIGGCLALGYGLTNRLLILQGNWEQPSNDPFQEEKNFPGIQINAMRKLEKSTSFSSSTNKKDGLPEDPKTSVTIMLNALKTLETKKNSHKKQRSMESANLVEFISRRQELFSEEIASMLFKTLKKP